MQDLKLNPTYIGELSLVNGTKVQNETVFESQVNNQDSIMGSIMKNASPYLYPLIVEHSLLASTFLYTSWSAIGRRYTMTYEENSLSSVSCQKESTSSLASLNLSSFSCLGSSKGTLFSVFSLVKSCPLICTFSSINIYTRWHQLGLFAGFFFLGKCVSL